MSTTTQPTANHKPTNAHERRPENLIPSLESVTDQPADLPNRVLLHAPPKWGKTSFAAMAPSAIFLMTDGEDGLLTLLKAKQLPPVKHFPHPAATTNHVSLAIQELIIKDHPYKTFVLDCWNGVERITARHIQANNFDNDLMKFDAFEKGMKQVAQEMDKLLALLDELRYKKKMTIFLLCHTTVVNFKNPQGEDWMKYQPDLNRKYVWPGTHKWADMILFGNFDVAQVKDKGKEKVAGGTKGKGGKTRTLYCVNDAAFDAGNRHGLPEEIDMGQSPQESWQNFINAFPKKG